MVDLFRERKRGVAVDEAARRREQLEREQRAITSVMDMAGGKILHSRLLEKGEKMKSRLFREDLDRREHTSGKLTGWIEALEWVILQMSPLKPKEGKNQ